MLRKDNEVFVSGLEVTITHSFDDAYRKFRQMVQKAGVLTDYRERGEYLKPGEAKRKKHREALNKIAELDRREAQIASGEWDRIQEKKQKKRQEKMAARHGQHGSDND